MSAYLLSIIGTVLLSAVLTAITPEGKTTSVIKGITKLACLLIIVAPVPKFLQSFSSSKGSGQDRENFETFFGESVIQTDMDFIKYYSEMRIRSAETALTRELRDNFSISVAVTLIWELDENVENGVYDVENIEIKKIKVQTENEISEEDKKAMWEYLTKNYCSEVQIE